MIAVDTQLLVYAHRGEMPLHEKALTALVGLASSGDPWAIPWPCVHEFLNTVTRPRLFDPPSTLDDGFAALDRWRDSATLHFIGEGLDHYERLRQVSVAGAIAGPLIHDARIAAICLSHGVKTLWSVDRDFSRFPSFRASNPLIAEHST
ncbi:MAG: TA system VapC family ribonuclease toxin [Tepidisphaeraceae bacterium]